MRLLDDKSGDLGPARKDCRPAPYCPIVCQRPDDERSSMIRPTGTVGVRAVTVSRSPWFRWALFIARGAVIWVLGSSRALPLEPGTTGRWVLRKVRHFVVYDVVGSLAIGALGPGVRRRWLAVVGVFVGLAAELHQPTVPHRSFGVEDIGIDTVSTMAGAAMARLPGRQRG